MTKLLSNLFNHSVIFYLIISLSFPYGTVHAKESRKDKFNNEMDEIEKIFETIDKRARVLAKKGQSSVEEDLIELENAMFEKSYPQDIVKLDWFQLLRQKKLRNGIINFDEITYKNISLGINNESVLTSKLFHNSTKKSFNFDPPMFQANHFTLNYMDTPIYSLYIPFDNITFFGNYLVFTDAGNFDKKTKIQSIFFIDLNKYLNNADLPVFRLPPVSTEKPIEKFSIKNGVLVLDDSTNITAEILEAHSEFQEIALNAMANSMNFNALEDTLPIIESLDAWLEKYIELQDEEVQKAHSSLVASEKALDDHIEKLKTHITAHIPFNTATEAAKTNVLLSKLINEPFLNHDFFHEYWKDAVNLYRKHGDKGLFKLGEKSIPLREKNLYERDASEEFLAKFIEFWNDRNIKKVKDSASIEASLQEFLRKKDNLYFLLGYYLRKQGKNLSKNSPILNEIQFKNSVQTITAKQAAQRGVIARTRLFWTRLSLPNPAGTGDIKAGMAHIVGARKLSNLYSIKSPFNEGMLQILKSPLFRYGAPVSLALTASIMYPEGAKTFLKSSLSITTTLLDFFYLKASQISQLSSETFKKTFIDSYKNFDSKYLNEDGSLQTKTKIGLSAIFSILFAIIFTPHFVANINRLRSDLKAEEKYRNKPTFKEAFIARQNDEHDKYLKYFRESYKLKYAPDLTIEQELLVNEFLSAMKRLDEIEKQRTGMKSAINSGGEKIGELKEHVLTTAEKLNRINSEVKRRERLSARIFDKILNMKILKRTLGGDEDYKIRSFAKAMLHFTLSYASFNNSAIAYTKIWQSWFGIRTFITYPVACASFMMYPKFFKTAIQDRGKIIIPTKLNGGTRPFYEYNPAKVFFNNQKSKQALGKLSWKMALDSLEEWEKRIVPVEEKIQKIVYQKSLDAFRKYIKSDKELTKVYKENGITNLADPTLKKLSLRSKTFFSAYYSDLYEKSMKVYLKNLVVKSYAKTGFEIIKDQNFLENELQRRIAEIIENSEKLGSEILEQDLSLKKLKNMTLENFDNIEIDSDTAKEIVSYAVTNEDPFERAKKTASNILGPKAIKLNTKNRVLRRLDPKQNMPIARMQTVYALMDDPKAMSRAVRVMIVSNLIDKPIELALTFFFLAGIDSDNPFLNPIHDEMFSEDSFFHLSKYIFGYGFIYGTAFSILSQSWGNLQMFELNNDNFDRIPEGADKRKSFTNFFFKKLFLDPNNSFKRNYMHNMMISISNLRAALITYASAHLLIFQRFDLDLYFLSYFTLFFVPISFFFAKLENALELSQSYHARYAPESLRSSTKVQKMLLEKSFMSRVKFNLIYRPFIENPFGNFIGNFYNLTLPGLGQRAFNRIVLFGYSPTELVELSAQKLGATLDFIPGAEKTINACKKVFTNNYTGWSKIKPK